MRTTVTVVMTLALLAGCALLPARAADIRYAPPKVELTLDSTSYEPGASLAWRYTLYNGNDHPLDLVFPTTQVYDLAIWKGDAMLARWSTGKDLSWQPVRPELVVEVAYDHMEGTRFRHTAQFRRWRPDRDPASCTYDQLDRPVRYDLAKILG